MTNTGLPDLQTLTAVHGNGGFHTEQGLAGGQASQGILKDWRLGMGEQGKEAPCTPRAEPGPPIPTSTTFFCLTYWASSAASI